MADMILEVKTTVAREIDKKITGHFVPDLIVEFLQGPWKEVMKIIGLRDGCEGKAWSAATVLVEDLIWSAQPKRVAKERQQLLALIPRLIQSLREGLTLICYEHEEINNFFKNLQRIHVNCITPVECKGANAETNKNRHSHDILQDIARQAGKHHAFQLDISDPVLLQSRYFSAVQSMALGTWVEFKDHSGVKRGKLAWKCDFTGEFTFLDRMYKVIADIPLRDLIQLLEHGKARIVSEVPLLDRAVDAVINGMKQYVGRDSALFRAAS